MAIVIDHTTKVNHVCLRLALYVFVRCTWRQQSPLNLPQIVSQIAPETQVHNRHSDPLGGYHQHHEKKNSFVCVDPDPWYASFALI